MLSGPPPPLFACNTQWKCIEDLNPSPLPPRCVRTQWKAPKHLMIPDPTDQSGIRPNYPVVKHDTCTDWPRLDGRVGVCVIWPLGFRAVSPAVVISRRDLAGSGLNKLIALSWLRCFSISREIIKPIMMERTAHWTCPSCYLPGTISCVHFPYTTPHTKIWL